VHLFVLIVKKTSHQSSWHRMEMENGWSTDDSGWCISQSS